MSGAYLHYWYADYVSRHGDDRYDSFNKAKNAADYLMPGKGISQKEFQKRKQRMISGNPANRSEFEELLDFFTNSGEALSGLRMDTYKASVVQGWSGMNSSVFGSGGGLTTPEELAERISDFCKELENKTNEMISKLNENVEAYKKTVVREYAETRGVSVGSGNFARKVIQDFLMHNGLKKLGLGTAISGEADSKINTCARACVLLAEALPSYGNGGALTMGAMKYSTGKSVRDARKKGGSGTKISNSGSHTLAIILGKLTGLWNNVVGSGAEIATKKAEEVLINKIVKEEEKVQQAFRSSGSAGKEISVSVRVSGGDMIQKTEETKGVSKPDVTISVSDGSVSIDYGASVKQYTPNPSDNSITITPVSETPFMKALTRYYPAARNTEYVLNLAGAHGGLGLKGKRGTGQAQSYSEEGLNERWRELVDAVTVRNFLDFIAGLGQAHGDNVLYLVSNGQVYSIADILDYVGNNPEMLHGRINQGNTSRILYRGALAKMNKWVYGAGHEKGGAKKKLTNKSRELALIRSNEAYDAIHGALENTKLIASLKMF